MSTQTERLEIEAEATRQRLSATVDELRSRLTPGHALDEIIAYTREGAAGEFVRNLGRDVARNPLPVTLAGAGLAWLMLARNGASDGERQPGTRRVDAETNFAAAGEAATDAADDFASGVLEGAHRTKDYVADQSRAATEAMSEFAASTRDTTASAYRTASAKVQDMSANVRQRSRETATRATEVGRGVVDLCREQPLVLAGIGIALGALVGALLPRTATEDHLVGRAADDLKSEGMALATESYEAARHAAERAAQSAQPDTVGVGAATSDGERSEGKRMATGNERGLT
jgi:ElaB/YqjD/DUF883 family membrane-anchored ribosome-binding protein